MWRVVVTYPAEADFEALVSGFTRIMGQPVSRDTVGRQPSSEAGSVMATWSNRTTRLTLYRGVLVGGGWRTTVTIVDQRIGP